MVITLKVAPGNLYNHMVLRSTNEISKNYKRICYITLNKTYRALLKHFKENAIDPGRFFFVDAISPKVFKMKPAKQCLFLDSLDDLSSIADKLLNLVKMNKIEFIIFDSVSSFGVYKSDSEMVEFFNYFLSFLEELDVDIMMIVLLEDIERPVVKQLKMRADHWEVELT